MIEQPVPVKDKKKKKGGEKTGSVLKGQIQSEEKVILLEMLCFQYGKYTYVYLLQQTLKQDSS